MLRLFRESLCTCSTPGVALTYFSMRQVRVFSTSFAASPGASVPTTSTGGVRSGNVSIDMRGVTTAGEDDHRDAEHQARERVAEREVGHSGLP